MQIISLWYGSDDLEWKSSQIKCRISLISDSDSAKKLQILSEADEPNRQGDAVLLFQVSPV